MADRQTMPGQGARATQDIVGGLLLVAMAGLALYMVQRLPAYGAVGFASGTAPRLFAYGLGALGLFIAVQGFLREGLSLEPWYFRAPICILGSIIVFALLVRTLGLGLTGIIAVLIAAGATSEVRWIEAVIFAIGMTVFCAILFPIVLGQPIPLTLTNTITEAMGAPFAQYPQWTTGVLFVLMASGAAVIARKLDREA